MKLSPKFLLLIMVISGLMIGYQAQSGLTKIYTPASINIASEVVEDYNDAVKAVNKATTPQAKAAANVQLNQAKTARTESLKDQATSKATQILNDRVNMPQNNLNPGAYPALIDQPMFCIEGGTSYPVGDTWIVSRGDKCKRCGRVVGGGGAIAAQWSAEVSCKYSFVQAKIVGNGRPFCTLYKSADEKNFSYNPGAGFPKEVHYPVRKRRIHVKLDGFIRDIECVVDERSKTVNAKTGTSEYTKGKWAEK